MYEVEKTTLVYSARWYDIRALILASSVTLIVGLGIAALAIFVNDRLERRGYARNNTHLFVNGRYIEGRGARPFALTEPDQRSAPTMFGFGIRIKLVPYQTRDIEKLVARQERGRWVCGGVIMPCGGAVFQKNR
jgi:hypothetical protein